MTSFLRTGKIGSLATGFLGGMLFFGPWNKQAPGGIAGIVGTAFPKAGRKLHQIAHQGIRILPGSTVNSAIALGQTGGATTRAIKQFQRTSVRGGGRTLDFKKSLKDVVTNIWGKVGKAVGLEVSPATAGKGGTTAKAAHAAAETSMATRAGMSTATTGILGQSIAGTGKITAMTEADPLMKVIAGGDYRIRETFTGMMGKEAGVVGKGGIITRGGGDVNARLLDELSKIRDKTVVLEKGGQFTIRPTTREARVLVDGEEIHIRKLRQMKDVAVRRDLERAYRAQRGTPNQRSSQAAIKRAMRAQKMTAEAKGLKVGEGLSTSENRFMNLKKADDALLLSKVPGKAEVITTMGGERYALGRAGYTASFEDDFAKVYAEMLEYKGVRSADDFVRISAKKNNITQNEARLLLGQQMTSDVHGIFAQRINQTGVMRMYKGASGIKIQGLRSRFGIGGLISSTSINNMNRMYTELMYQTMHSQLHFLSTKGAAKGVQNALSKKALGTMSSNLRKGVAVEGIEDIVQGLGKAEAKIARTKLMPIHQQTMKTISGIQTGGLLSSLGTIGTIYYAGRLATKFVGTVAKQTLNTMDNLSRVAANINRMEFGTGQALVTPLATTERQRALQAINQSGISARSYLGKEAKMLAEM